MTTTLFVRGLPACSCQVKWFPVFETELMQLNIIDRPLRLAQLIGDAKASAKVHTGGGCADWWETDIRIAQIAREMGAPATWPRTTGSFADNQHTHSGIRGCPHMASGGLAQIREVDLGGDGLLGTAPDDPRLSPHLNGRTWQEGIAWAKRRQRIRAINAKIAEARAEIDRHNATIAAARDDKAELQAKIARWIETRDSL